MILTSLVKKQLLGLAIATVVGAVVLGLVYLRVPEAIGYGRYTVTAAFQKGAQLYSGAEVTYRGHPVGKVTAMDIAEEGILVTMRLREEVAVPSNVVAEIHSRSAVGEQYVDLVPASERSSEEPLVDGDTIPLDRTTTPVEIGPLLDNVGRLVESLPAEDLNVLLGEADDALAGREGDLASIIDSGGRFVGEADAAFEATRVLLRDFEPLAGALNSRSGQLDRATRNLALVTATLRAGDQDLERLLAGGPGLAREATTLLSDLQLPLRSALVNLGVVGEQLATYNSSFRNVLSVYPRLVAAIQSITLPHAETSQIALDLANLNDPPACLEGFLPPSQWRDPADQSKKATPRVYCQAAPDDARVVSGARNLPCVRYPGVRAPTGELCRELGVGR